MTQKKVLGLSTSSKESHEINKCHVFLRAASIPANISGFFDSPEVQAELLRKIIMTAVTTMIFPTIFSTKKALNMVDMKYGGGDLVIAILEPFAVAVRII